MLDAGVKTVAWAVRRMSDRCGLVGVCARPRGSKNDGGLVYFAMVEFVDAQAGRHTFQAGSSGVKGLPVGQGVPVRYLPEAPKSARIDLRRRRVEEVAVRFAVGTLFTAIGIWMLATGR
ncbi:DUF3592 domain-containing protein [Streptomyces noursei]|uniref:DUF3592 domain-containing protein n=1 Tax=Streptomyces noursei TaxID=1971 RepID=UPI0021556AA5|nr:DUF3592 domain-containing protein [Streptomyces noursei]